MDSNPRFSADLGKAPWFAAGFMGQFLKRENIHPVCFAKDSFGKSIGRRFSAVDAFEVTYIRGRECGSWRILRQAV
jgi:hypothetical protein